MKKINSSPAGILSCLLVMLFCTVSCKRTPAAKQHRAAKTGSATIKYAKGFGIDYYDHYKLVSIYSGSGTATDTTRYVLVPRGTKAPEGYNKAQLIEIPVKSLVATSSMHVALAEFAGSADAITGLGSFQYITSAIVRKNIAAGKIKEVGTEGTMNNEMLITMKPGLVMVTGNPAAKFSAYATLTGAGVPVMLNSEWLETTPLGRAEWVKLMAALMDKEDSVNAKFKRIETAYTRLAAMGQKAVSKPSVVSGMPYKGTWYVPDGDSYMVQFFKDAGAAYQWANTKEKGSLALNFETVAPVALKADFWLNLGEVNTKKDVQAIDVRYADFKPFKNGNLFNNNGKVNSLGANDFWESGAVNPDVVLADLIFILHPDLLPNHHLVYYKKLN
ncbi:ABC transporter substrate-binding protein [Pedobacter sp. L105]|uniref:ABC transporter substrate-binding protein n=1 Tax=Pedobacter sp. L105 TaxID=1641871 RepID=UPI00131D465D|nr:ABC transporter substrate-binding protein [Pedobacter sp. L105]